MKRIYLLIGIIIIVFTLFIITIFIPRDYKLDYKVNNLDVNERFSKNEKGYFFTIKYNKTEYPLYISYKYSRKRKQIENITIKEKNNETCLTVKVFNNNYNICFDGETLKDLYTMSSDYLKEFSINLFNESVKKEYKNISFYNLNNNYFIWNYKGYYHINGDNIEELKLFNKDNYKNYLSFQTDQYLVFPDYNSDYYFTKMYVYDVKSDLLNDINFDFEISYDSYYLGHLNNKVYLIDKKNKNEYEINLKKNSLELISHDNTALFYNGKNWSEVSLSKLVNKKTTFPTTSIYNYFIDNNKLYLNIDDHKIVISNKRIKQIVYVNNSTIYYLSEDKLYSYDYLKGENLLLKNPEWNFNYNNHVFIFN